MVNFLKNNVRVRRIACAVWQAQSKSKSWCYIMSASLFMNASKCFSIYRNVMLRLFSTLQKFNLYIKFLSKLTIYAYPNNSLPSLVLQLNACSLLVHDTMPALTTSIYFFNIDTILIQRKNFKTSV